MNKISRKKYERRHIRRDPVQEMHHKRALEHIRAHQIIDNDAMATSPSSMEATHGRSPIGLPCIYPQFEIGDRCFSLFISACSLGVIAHFIKEDSPINGDDIAQYLENKLKPMLMDDSFGLWDNAKVHKTQRTLLALESTFRGRYMFAAPYSPHLKPVKRIFILIRNYLKDNEELALANPVVALNNAVQLYSINGPEGYKCQEFFAFYDINYDIAHLI